MDLEVDAGPSRVQISKSARAKGKARETAKPAQLVAPPPTSNDPNDGAAAEDGNVEETQDAKQSEQEYKR